MFRREAKASAILDTLRDENMYDPRVRIEMAASMCYIPTLLEITPVARKIPLGLLEVLSSIET